MVLLLKLENVKILMFYYPQNYPLPNHPRLMDIIMT